MEQVTAAFLEHGLLGAALVAMGVAFWAKDQELRRVQDARVEDAKKVTQTLLDMQQDTNEVVQALTHAIQPSTPPEPKTRGR